MSREISNMRKTDRVVQEMWQRVNEAKAKFEGRWMYLSLRRVDDELYKNLMEQIDIFDEVSITGTVKDIAEHGEATLRGFVAATKVMEKAKVIDDSYMMGQCHLTGLRVAIGTAKGSVKHIQEVYGPDVVFFSPDEIASLVALHADVESKAIIFVEATKRQWPGATMVERYMRSDDGS